jgi:hypothetical protein
MKLNILTLILFLLSGSFALQAQTVIGKSAPLYVEIGEDELPNIEAKLPKIYAVVIGVSEYQNQN